MTEHIKTIKYKGYTIHVDLDEDPRNPREDDCFARIATFSLLGYRIKDKGEDYLPEDMSGWEAVEAHLRGARDAEIILPLYLYDHSVQSISTESFIGRAQHANWDSGRIGVVYVTRKDILDNYMVKRITQGIRARAIKLMKDEVEAYDAYIRGEVYRYTVSDQNEETNMGGGYTSVTDAIAAAKEDIEIEVGYSQGAKS